MKNEQDGSNKIGLQQTNSIFQLWNQLKNSIFNVLFVLLNQSDDGQDQSLIGLSIQTGLDYLQMMAFPFDTAVIEVWNGGETLSAFTSIFTNLSVNQFIPGVGFSTFLIMLYLLIFVIILVILDIVYVSYSFSKKKFKFTWPLQFLAKVVPLCVTVFFLPIMQTLLSVVSCQNSQDIEGVQVMQNFPDVICWEGWHMFHAVVTLFFTSIFVFISSIVALTIFQPRMTISRMTARQNSSGQVIFIVNKMICQFVFSFTPFDNTWIYCIMLFLLSGWLWTSYNVDQPYYNKNASKFFRICSSYYFWTNLMLFVSQILLDFGFQGGLVIWMCGLPFIGISIVFQRKSNIDKLFSSNLKFRSGQQLQSHLQYVLQLIHNRDKDKNSYMLLLGYIQKHIEICMQEDCPLKVKKIKIQEDLTQIEENCRQLIKQLLRMYKQGVKKYPNCTKLRLSFAFFYMQKLQSNNKAYQQFTIAQKTDPTFGQQFIIYRFKKIIRQNLQENQDQDNDLIQIIRFDNHVSLCQQAMLYSARLHKDFWTQLQEQTPDLKKLNSIGSKITQTTLVVKQNYRQVQKINSHVSQVIHNYALYLIFIGQAHLEGKKVLQQAKRIYFEKKQSEQNDMGIFTLKNNEYGDLTNYEQNYNSLIKVSIESDSIGKIIYSNDSFTQLTGYIKEDITERTIDKILPSVFGFYHRNAIKMWLHDDKKKVMINNNSYMMNPHNGFIRQKSGFLIPVNYRVSYNTEQNCFLTVLRPDPAAYTDFSCKIFIMTNVNGMIKDISPLGYMFFRIGRQQCQKHQWSLQQLGIPANLNKEQLFSRSGLVIKLKQQLKMRTTFQSNTLATKQQFGNQGTSKNSLLGSLDQNTQNSQVKEQAFVIKAQQIWINASQDVQEIFDDEALYKNGKVKIGITYTLQKLNYQIHVSKNQQKNSQLNTFDYLFQDMYQQDPRYIFQDIEDPQQVNRQKKSKILAQMLIDMNNGQAVSFEQKRFRKYAQELKIKTYRYQNNDFIRIYNVQYENDEQNKFQYENDDLCGKHDIEKLQKKHYQQKIKQAINTNIQHQQINCLSSYSLVFFVVLCTLSFLSFFLTIQQMEKISKLTQQGYVRSKDTEFLTNSIQQSIEDIKKTYSLSNDTLPNQQLGYYDSIMKIEQIKQYTLTFNPDISVSCQLQNSQISNKTVLQAMNIIQGRIVNYFDPESVSKTVQIAYKNFITSIYSVLQKFTFISNISVTLIIILALLSFINALLMLLIWIYNIMKIDQKRFDIMIWFLDIPIDYVIYLQNNCNRFIKNYIPIKQLQERGIHMDDKEHYCDEYEEKKVDQDQQIDEQNKARKIMIARHRKKTFFSRFNCGYFKTLWLLVYSTVISVFFCIEINLEKSNFQFINSQWNLINNQFLWSSSFSIITSLDELKNTSYGLDLSSINIEEFQERLRQNFLNTLTKHNKTNQIALVFEQVPQIADIYSQTYYGDLCLVVDNPQCDKLLNGKLRAGITTYQSYLVGTSTHDVQQIVKSHYIVVGPAMMKILQKWKEYLSETLQSFKTLSNVIIYLFVTFTFIGYVSLWKMYLKNQNTKINQTIQMLNMIPMKMLPKNRKDTRDFLNWLIQQANKKKQQEQD